MAQWSSGMIVASGTFICPPRKRRNCDRPRVQIPVEPHDIPFAFLHSATAVNKGSVVGTLCVVLKGSNLFLAWGFTRASRPLKCEKAAGSSALAPITSTSLLIHSLRLTSARSLEIVIRKICSWYNS